MAENKNHSLVRRLASAIEKVAPGPKRILSGMVTDTLAVAHAENVETIFNQGMIYYNGDGVSKDYNEASKFFHKAAERNHTEAQFHLGGCYATGHGVRQDDNESIKWLRKAAEQGHSRAQYYLGLSYEEGDGVKKDLAEAVNWYRKVGDALGRDGDGAIDWSYPYDQGDAVKRLARCYTQGRGVAQDLAEAYMWLKFAAEELLYSATNADPEAELTSFCEQMSNSELAEGEKRYQHLQQMRKEQLEES